MDYLIIGNGVAGVEAAVTIRKEDNDANIKIITEGEELFYYRPRLIEYLGGEMDFSKAVIHKEEFYQKKNIENIFATKIKEIDPENKILLAQENKEFSYDKLLIAAGAEPIVIEMEGRDKKGVFTFRNKNDAEEIYNYVQENNNVIIVGGGVLGIETANTLAKLGKNVTVVEYFDRLLPKQLDKEGAAILKELLEDKGINFELGKTVDAIKGESKIEEVELNTAERLAADALIFSVGVKPRDDFKIKGDLKRNKGILVNDYLETSICDIYAAGDIAEHKEICYGLWKPAKEQGAIAGKNMVESGSLEYNGSSLEVRLKVTGIPLFSAGDNIDYGDNDGIETIIKKDGKSYKKLVIKDGKLIGIIVLGDNNASLKLSKVFNKGEDDNIDLGQFLDL
ncbi:NAD(P)/FAD-dependent oxidoreductase [Natroniella sp. ANB-PHB2]|uniref:NAD(P)/FAD-dependent oxidoreductase n=1 Tax=Natroniella sp. ANB-PHB2 TaxID=3384444 RepID=UPI0038D50352